MTLDLSTGRLESARLRAGLTVDQLWVRYVGNGGTASRTEFTSFLASARWPAAFQYDITVSALNDRFTELHLNGPLAYSDGDDGGAADGPPP